MKTKSERNLDLRSFLLLVFLAVGVIVLIQLPVFFRTKVRDKDAYAANRDRMTEMSQTERDRVKRRAQRYFDELNESERDRIRQLHHDLQHDNDADKLKQVLERFNEWFTSLSPYEREDLREKLRKADDPEEKRTIIEDYRNEQFVRTLDFPDRQDFAKITDPLERKKKISQWRNRPEMRFGRGPFTAIEISKLEPLLNAIAGKITLNDMEKKQLDSMTGSSRSYRIMALMLKQRSRQRNQSSAPFSDTALRELVEEVINDDELKKQLIGFRGSRNRIPFVIFVIGQSLSKERGRTAGNPTEEQLSEFFAKLEPKEREELRQTASSERKRKLRFWYFRSGGEDGPEFQAYMSEYFRMMRGGRFRPPQGGRGSRGGGKPSERERTGPSQGERPKKFGPPKEKLSTSRPANP